MNVAFLEGNTATNSETETSYSRESVVFLLPNFSFLPSLESKNKKDLLDQEEVVETTLRRILFSATTYTNLLSYFTHKIDWGLNVPHYYS